MRTSIMRCRYEPHTARHQDRDASPLAAAQEVPDNRRDGVVRAALVSIREKLKDARNVKVTKQKMKSKGAKVLARRKSVGRPEGTAMTGERRRRAGSPSERPMDEVAGF
jgi:hypothetical protein